MEEVDDCRRVARGDSHRYAPGALVHHNFVDVHVNLVSLALLTGYDTRGNGDLKNASTTGKGLGHAAGGISANQSSLHLSQ